jgi:hypothetical protein
MAEIMQFRIKTQTSRGASKNATDRIGGACYTSMRAGACRAPTPGALAPELTRRDPRSRQVKLEDLLLLLLGVSVASTLPLSLDGPDAS